MIFYLPLSKVHSILPFLLTVLSKEDTILNGKYNYCKKIFLDPNFPLSIENLTDFEEIIDW
jgi:hypothetical protein